ncbi:phosphoenolpyruvate carboxylase [Christiangramia forsetii]|uniref:Phosphoenolpyruvate carboxylase n=2 Tax=Christiangramia forsetii TaxID=411153 RepID=A0M1G5_CHRFK|nr:phosphoenolpyruvate carboxylase [Christiangramia forsetii]GGG42557.1 phosphoenolpyruvate carboxylase [Christiangramia forsetii]CAL66460.1 phosphoenolpyruvate carboxylase [Christiangramia forsetii KT0803]
MHREPRLDRFNDNVLAKYQVYNSIFLTLPYSDIRKTGALLPLFQEICETGFNNNENPSQIVDLFFEKYGENPSEEEKVDLLFRFIQYIERQVVLFDAIEDASFSIVNNMDGRGTLRSVKEEAEAKQKVGELKDYLKRFNVRPTLTAHPTQFYPGTVLGIITDLDKAIQKNDLVKIRQLLAQLGKTPFFKKEKPTPYDEAVNLIWYFENVFYQSASKIHNYIQQNIFDGEDIGNQVVNLGFWPGGDRDGNPFVTTEITLRVAKRLRRTILLNYYRDIRKLKRRLTFREVHELMTEIEKGLYDSAISKSGSIKLTLEDFKSKLLKIKSILIEKHQSLFIEEVDDMLNKVHLFGYHFATLDIRQDSSIHEEVLAEISKLNPELIPSNYNDLNDDEQIKILSNVKGKLDPEEMEEGMMKATISSMFAMQEIQEKSGELGANRYIISNCGSVQGVLQPFAFLKMTGWEKPSVDVVPLFETVPDLQDAHNVMEKLYTNPVYKDHLKRRGNKQTIMLGFSDGTKDGGYLMANWSIYKAKESLTKISREYGIKVVFFDGRGGPPARGGGKTHQFYASLGPTIENEEIHLTVQGQTISSNFGTKDSCTYNLEQLLSSGVSNEIFSNGKNVLKDDDRKTMTELAEISYETYTNFKKHPRFIPYLEKMSTLKYYAKTNIGSRPSKRNQSAELNLSDLRAIPFVGSWSQLKQNVPGFFGVGTAMEKLEKNGEFAKVKQLYDNSEFFRTLLENSMMSLTKSFFPLTAYMKNDEEFGEFWQLIHEEFERTKKMLLKVTGYNVLMQNQPAGRASIQARERIVLPLLTIQQHALRQVQELSKNPENAGKELETFEKMVTRSLYGNINASRNSA